VEKETFGGFRMRSSRGEATTLKSVSKWKDKHPTLHRSTGGWRKEPIRGVLGGSYEEKIRG